MHALMPKGISTLTLVLSWVSQSVMHAVTVCMRLLGVNDLELLKLQSVDTEPRHMYYGSTHRRL